VSSASLPPSGLVEGATLAGKYRIGRQLGAGGMCIVYEAEHINLRQAVALKLLKPELSRDTTAVARFAQEAQAAAKLRSPNVARVYDVDKLPDGNPYITMELLVGHDLGTELSRRYALPVDLAVDYVRQASNGISEAHALGIVHRDLKPENLFLTELGEMTERRLLKILDFGIAKNVGATATKLTADDAVFGTVDYMSPEQIRSASTVDHRTDLWSLGVILFELLTGRTPYTGDARSVIAQIVSDPVVPPSRFVPTLPPGLVAVVMKALAKDPAARFQSADELRRALTPFTEGIEPITEVLARIPTHSVPRRNLDSSQPSLNGIRDARTNLSFATDGAHKGIFARRAFTLPLLVGAFVGLLGLTLWKGNFFKRVVHETTVQVVAPPPADPAATTTAAALPVNPTPAAATTPSILGVSTPPDAPTPTAATGPGTEPRAAAGAAPHPPPRAAKPKAPPHPSATTPAAPPAPPPPAPTPTSALPKHL
jgi:serine/threonine protein kinase